MQVGAFQVLDPDLWLHPNLVASLPSLQAETVVLAQIDRKICRLNLNLANLEPRPRQAFKDPPLHTDKAKTHTVHLDSPVSQGKDHGIHRRWLPLHQPHGVDPSRVPDGVKSRNYVKVRIQQELKVPDTPCNIGVNPEHLVVGEPSCTNLLGFPIQTVTARCGHFASAWYKGRIVVQKKELQVLLNAPLNCLHHRVQVTSGYRVSRGTEDNVIVGNFHNKRVPNRALERKNFSVDTA